MRQANKCKVSAPCTVFALRSHLTQYLILPSTLLQPCPVLKPASMSLRHGGRIEPRPTVRLSGWFEKRGLWTVRHWLELDGSTLTYRRRQGSSVEWSCDLRECRMNAGRARTEIIIKRPGLDQVSLFAISVDELKVWFAEMKKVSDSVYDFYRISAKIGNTKTGLIYFGRDRRMERAVAIVAEEKNALPLHKMLLYTKRDLSVVSASQSHPSLVRVEDLFESTKRFYIVTELVSGGLLSTKLERKPLASHIVRVVLADILQALGHLHSLDIVHGAVDSTHIVCTTRRLPCKVKLITYGSAVARRDARLLGEAGRNSAPEVVCFERRTPASDVFGAGVLLYQLLTGRDPFPAHHEAEYLTCVSKGVDTKGFEEGLGQVLKAMLADDASGRPTALECLEFLWFAEGVGELDAGCDAFERMESDPKTVIMELESIRMTASAISKNLANPGSDCDYDGEF